MADLNKEQKIARRKIRHRNELGWGLGLGAAATTAAFGANFIATAANGFLGVGNAGSAIASQAAIPSIIGVIIATVAGIIIGVVKSRKEERIQAQINKRNKKLAAKALNTTKTKTVVKEVAPVEKLEEIPLPAEFKTDRVTNDVIRIIDSRKNIIAVLHKGPAYDAKEGVYSTERELRYMLNNVVPTDTDCIIEYNGKTVSGHTTYKGVGSDMTRRDETIRDKKEAIEIAMSTIYTRDRVETATMEA